jgi:hypothetical protein
MPELKTYKGIQELRSWIRNDDIRYDPWGTAMAWGFAVCRVLDAMGEDVPDEWQYSRSPVDTETVEDMAGDPDAHPDENIDLEYPDCEVALMVTSNAIDSETLLYWGEVLHRYIGLCKHHGRDY